MLLWVIFALMTAGVLLALLHPLLRPGEAGASRAAYDLAIYRDQLAELDRDLERGLVGAEAGAAARLEIQRRLLATAPRETDAAPARRPPSRPAIAAILLGVPLPALALYLLLGAPWVPDQPLAGRGAERGVLAADGALDLKKARAALESRLAAHPGSDEGWLLLARTDGALGDWQAARTAMDKALALTGRRADVLEAAGELLTREARGSITPAASALFREALRKDPQSPGARYDLALALAQQGDLAGAIAGWQALERDSPADAPWLPNLRRALAAAQQVQSGAPALPSAPGAQPPPEVAAMLKLPPEQRLDAIRGMVAGLAARLAQQPDDRAGWTRLGRSYLVLGEAAPAADAYGHALALAPGDPELALGRAQALREAAGPGPALPAAAVEAYRKVLALTPEQPEALWFLGQSAKQQGDDAEAARLWQRLLGTLDPAAPEAIEIRKQLAALKPAG